MNPYMLPLTTFAPWLQGLQYGQAPQNPYLQGLMNRQPPQVNLRGQRMKAPRQEQSSAPDIQVPRSASYDPNAEATNMLGMKMKQGTMDYMSDLGAGIGQAFDNPVVQALSYADRARRARIAGDPAARQQEFENQLNLRKQQFEESKAGRTEWQLGSMFDDKGNEQKIFYDKNDPTNYVPLGGSKAKEPGALYKIVDKNGKPVYETAENAQGQKPYEKSDNFGFSVQSPDGTVISYGNGQSPIQKPTAGDLEKKILQSGDMLGRLRDIQGRYDQNYLTFKGQADNWMQTMKEKAGVGLDPEQQKRVSDFAAFQRDVSDNLSLYLNQLSGAAISPAEGERLAKTMPTMDDGPTQFQSKLGATVRSISKAQARAKWALQKGVGRNPWEADAEFNQAVQQRGDQLADEIKKQNPQATDEQIKQSVSNQIRMEYGF